ncbi:hypothetical protein FQA39_LY18050 [Lamprigera yunnana]|nr:hypothetical protein FQA39_LY18050 [Lamprigera yunnana]
MSEEELEQKFIALSLAFSIDAATIADRSERQRRYRDQTETNLNTEIDKLSEKINQIRFMSVDAERAEHLAGLLTQIDVIVRASSLASISAERFGAVQHEARLAEAVNLMINHVTLLKQQRDSTRNICNIQSKKVLQDTNTTDLINTKKNLISERFLAQRRASIATITQSPELTKPVATNSSEVKRLTRRTSDISSRVSAFIRSNRPSRLELGVDLDKIKEGIVDENSVSDSSECSENCYMRASSNPQKLCQINKNSTMLSLK